MSPSLRFLLCAVAAAALSQDARAATATNSLRLSLTVNTLCSVTSGGINFGNVSNMNTARNGTGTINVRCPVGVPYVISLGAGVNGGGTVTTRRMKHATSNSRLGYALYRNAGRTQNWGQTIGVDTVSATGNGTGRNHTVYGRVTATPGAPRGTYADVVLITVSY